LTKLQASAPAHSYSYTQRAIIEELGEPIEDIFDFFDKTPLASGSIAQVYRAILRGREVAVKVRHPNVYEQIKLDFTIMKAMANFLHRMPGLHWLNLPESTTQFSGTIASQTKLDVEGRHLVLFNRFFRHWKKAHFPQSIMFTDGVLVESFEHGELVSDFSKRMAKLNAKGQSMAARDIQLAHFIVTIGEDIYLKMLIEDNLMHADLHPGNILIQYTLNGSPMTPADYRRAVAAGIGEQVETDVVLVDAGMVASLTSDERSNFIGMLEATGDGNGRQAAYFISKFSNKRHYSKETIEAFQQDTEVLFAKICRGYGTNVDMGEVLRGILTLVRVHHITIDANYATLFLNVLCLDGLAKSILPSYNVLDGAMNLLKLHQLTRMIPIPGAHDVIVRTGLPWARWLKRKFDNSFLRDILHVVREQASHVKAKLL
jgi:aarF domain-containing kinase